MPTSATFSTEVFVPTDDEYKEIFPKLPLDQRLDWLKALLRQPASIYDMLVATRLGRTAIEAVAAQIRSAYDTIPDPQQPKPEWDFVKQRAGAFVCVVMEMNGFRRTGVKQSVAVDEWNRAELYQKNEG